MPLERPEQQLVKGTLPADRLFKKHAGDNPLRQIEAALEVAPLAYRQFTRGPQSSGHAFCEFEIPPALAAAPLHVDGSYRSFVADTLPETGDCFRIIVDHIAPPWMRDVVAAAELEMRVEFYWQPAGFVPPVLEQRLIRLQETLGATRLKSLEP